MKKIITFLLLFSFLTSCQEIEKDIVTEKAEFYVDTISGGDLSETVILEKIGQVRSGQDISLSSNAIGRVSNIYVKTGDSVQTGQILAVLEDTIGSYGTNLQRSGIAVEREEINYESTKLTLDKNVFDAQLNFNTLEKNLIALRNDSEQNILVVKDTLENSQYKNLDSSSALRLESLDSAIEKSKLDYNIKVSSDEQSIEGYKATLKKEFSGLLTLIIDVQEFADSLLGITDINKDDNNKFEDFLGAQDKNQKRSSEIALRSIIDFREAEEFENMNSLVKKPDILQREMIEVIDFIGDGYDLILDLLNTLEITVNNSIRSEGNLGQVEISSFISSINSYQSLAQGSYGSYISIGTNIKTFLNTYEDNHSSLLASIQLKEKEREIEYKNLISSELTASTSYERTIISIEDKILDLESKVKSAKETLENAQRNRDVTLRSLQNSISDAQVNYSSNIKEFGKLTLKSPINGTIGSVSIDKGQEVSIGSPAFEIVSDSSPEVEISFSKSEKNLISVDTTVRVIIAGESYMGKIYAISDVADENLNYKATIVFESDSNIIGNLVQVEIPIQTNKMMIPINIISTQGEKVGTLKTLSGSSLEDIRVRMGEMYGEYVEIISCAKNCEDLRIITNDVGNYDENKFIIVEK